MTRERNVTAKLGFIGGMRFIWKQLTSMRIALMLLLLLAIAAVPGSIFPQTNQDLQGVQQYLIDHPKLGSILQDLGFFDVYTSIWFSAIYILLFISLIGCIIPRTIVHLRELGKSPVRVPSKFERMPVYRKIELAQDDDTGYVAQAHKILSGRVLGVRRFKVKGTEGKNGSELSAETGNFRETGNLIFHISLVGLLIAFAIGQLFGYRGQVILIEGRGFANSIISYDTFERGSLFQERDLKPFNLVLDSFSATFRQSDGQSQDFEAKTTLTNTVGEVSQEILKVNHPLAYEDLKIYLQGNGYAPNITVRDSAGKVAFSGPVVFIPQDQVYTSKGVIKVPDVSVGPQIGFSGYLLPTATVDENGARSTFPQPNNPVLILDVYKGDLGLDTGVPQNVYKLQTEKMELVEEQAGGMPLVVRPGETKDLPGGLGTIEWKDLPRFVALDLRDLPGLHWTLVFSISALLGLCISLFTPRRRIWIRQVKTTEHNYLEVAALAKGNDQNLDYQVEKLVTKLGFDLEVVAQDGKDSDDHR